MRAWLSHAAGGPESLRLESVPDPVAAPGTLLIRVAAVSLNFPDTLIIQDKYQYCPPRPFIPGTDIAGTIIGVGAHVSQFAIGDRVAARVRHGGLGEQVVAEALSTFLLPDCISFTAASALVMVYGTALHGLVDRAHLATGEKLLVLGAGGGIGTAAVQIGKALGAEVVAGLSSQEKAEAARRAGADDVVIYPSAPLDRSLSRGLADRFKAACPVGYDIIFDPVGGAYAEPALRAIAWEGRYMVVGFTAGIPAPPLNLPLLKACSVVGVSWGAWAERNPDRMRANMTTVLDLWREGRIFPQIGGIFSFEAGPAAIARLERRSAIGKLVVAVEPGEADAAACAAYSAR